MLTPADEGGKAVRTASNEFMEHIIGRRADLCLMCIKQFGLESTRGTEEHLPREQFLHFIDGLDKDMDLLETMKIIMSPPGSRTSTKRQRGSIKPIHNDAHLKPSREVSAAGPSMGALELTQSSPQSSYVEECTELYDACIESSTSLTFRPFSGVMKYHLS